MKLIIQCVEFLEHLLRTSALSVRMAKVLRKSRGVSVIKLFTAVRAIALVSNAQIVF